MDKKISIKRIVKQQYGQIALSNSSCCAGSCCAATNATGFGYSADEVASIKDANLGLGCGNPVAISSLKEGQVVLDLGSGAGIDCFLAAKRIGSLGKVIGVDMTPEMIAKAKENAAKYNFKNVEFLLGDIEALPLDDDCVDVVISNCVINLAIDKGKVFREVYRVLKDGGKMAISDIVLNGNLPKEVVSSAVAYVSCIAGAIQKDEYSKLIYDAGFSNVEIVKESTFVVGDNFIESVTNGKVSGNHYNDCIKSINVTAMKKK
ncbi:MAG: arsenite methyltransferase [Spirochaetota bacterium]